MKWIGTFFMIALLTLGTIGCSENSSSDESIGLSDIGVIELESKSNEDSFEEIEVIFDEAIMIDLCFILADSNHVATIYNEKTGVVLSMEAQDEGYNCATDTLEPVEFDAGSYILKVSHDLESEDSSLIGLAFTGLEIEDRSKNRAEVNDQITDAVTQANVKVLGDAPAMAMGNLYQATAQALSNAAHNATTSQQHVNLASEASSTLAIATLYSVDTAVAE